MWERGRGGGGPGMWRVVGGPGRGAGGGGAGLVEGGLGGGVAVVDVEGGRWQATESYGGSYGNTEESYGLPQADPGTKMAYWPYTVGHERAGTPTPGDWATNPWTQLAWARNYAIGRYGSVCAAWQYRDANGYW